MLPLLWSLSTGVHLASLTARFTRLIFVHAGMCSGTRKRRRWSIDTEVGVLDSSQRFHDLLLSLVNKLIIYFACELSCWTLGQLDSRLLSFRTFIMFVIMIFLSVRGRYCFYYVSLPFPLISTCFFFFWSFLGATSLSSCRTFNFETCMVPVPMDDGPGIKLLWHYLIMVQTELNWSSISLNFSVKT